MIPTELNHLSSGIPHTWIYFRHMSEDTGKKRTTFAATVMSPPHHSSSHYRESSENSPRSRNLSGLSGPWTPGSNRTQFTGSTGSGEHYTLVSQNSPLVSCLSTGFAIMRTWVQILVLLWVWTPQFSPNPYHSNKLWFRRLARIESITFIANSFWVFCLHQDLSISISRVPRQSSILLNWTFMIIHCG